MKQFTPSVLVGENVQLEPLSRQHEAGLKEAILDGELWKLFVTLVPHPDKLDGFFTQAEQWFDAGGSLAYATVDKTTGKVAGSTRFMKACFNNKRVEIGFTFLAESYQKTGVNIEAKLLMLTHAFEVLDFNRVELLTDYLNHGSRMAIAKLGAKEEGILRSHMVMPDGRVRDSVIFSIVKSEWPGVKRLLESRLDRSTR